MKNKKPRVIVIICLLLASSLASTTNVFSDPDIRNVDIVKLIVLGILIGVMLTTIISLLRNKTVE